ncbi:oxygenase MpaB family protein [Phenylobacterium deserti]|uniref:ER-bound oxygenase mpaB/mpaB'/Rubber oxygenase catalytic domain-containing protein n=1 Tax=Phenylobacterium deserti TaxID=1914756 RepID=A0A328AEB2_9CAUL|nr:oxygenase MpaB family protein [Phenylobacterium deserti]RAK51098.1 hypothetical protein DJ018_17445 [Phenylobacterium deserti]
MIRRQLFGDGALDYAQPAGDPGLFGPDSVTWRVHANPVILAIGGVAAVILELAEPRVRSGVWEHSTFRTDPLGRMQRTADAAMITTYGPTAAVERRIAMVNRMHERVRGSTPEGQAYQAMDPELLTWVQVTAGYGFLNAYLRYVEPGLSPADQDRYFAEAAAVGERFGTGALPRTVAEVEQLFAAMRPKLKPHPIIGEFLGLVERTSPVGLAGRAVQPLLVDAAVDLLPAWAPLHLQITRPAIRLRAAQRLMRALAASARFAPNEIVSQARARVGADDLRAA